MTTFPSLVRWSTASGAVRYRLGDPLVDRYLEFVAGRARPNTLRATAFDLKTFFSVVAKDPLEVTPALSVANPPGGEHLLVVVNDLDRDRQFVGVDPMIFSIHVLRSLLN